MPYVLGIDVGTCYTAAALCRLRGSAWGPAEVVPLHGRTPLLPTMLYLGREGVVVGAPAAGRALAEPGRVARDFVHRIGDDVPLVLGGQACSAQELTAVFIRSVVDLVEGAEGVAADRVVITHRAGWGGYRRGLLRAELARQELAEAILLPEAVAAAEYHAAQDLVYAGERIGVYGLGASTVEAAITRRADNGVFDLLDWSESVEDLGGTHFDDVLTDRVREGLGRIATDLDPADPDTVRAMAVLRRQCGVAKEQLSAVLETTVPVRLPAGAAEVRVSRAEFEELIRPAVDGTVENLLRVIRPPGSTAAEVNGVVLVGGSARVPLVRDLVGAALPGRIAVHPEPDLGIARGAALAGRRLLAAEGVGPDLPAPTEETLVFVPPDLSGLDAEPVEDLPPERPPIELTPLDLPEHRLLRRFMPGVRPAVLGVVVMLIMVVGVVLTLMLEPRTGSTSQSPSAVLHSNHN
ncbi:MAG TPA: Hsp70 family protein [Pseudonocardiaceae bacterium]|jgi:molecular chaperone DnaK (HSP70)|nr:Hsp70 family protein [Pseudonocardiaceae bacterium]